jgi:protein-S-isoprenylcysteine O-methyltransferase Ste14
MMMSGTTLVVLMNFAYIGILPRIFFDKGGKYNLNWWVTAGPLFISPVIVILVALGILAVPVAPFEQASAVLGVISIALISLTIGNHRVPLALWHQKDDAPKEIVTWGAYKRIRHPFYVSFILAQISALFLAPHPIVLGSLVYTVFILSITAAKEERKLSASAFGEQYRAYMKTAGRFIPRL